MRVAEFSPFDLCGLMHGVFRPRSFSGTSVRNEMLGAANSHTKFNTVIPLAARQKEWLTSRFIPHRHRPGAELQPAHELQIDMLR